MTIDSNVIVSATEANQNFSRIARLAEQKGHVVVFKFSKEKILLLHQILSLRLTKLQKHLVPVSRESLPAVPAVWFPPRPGRIPSHCSKF